MKTLDDNISSIVLRDSEIVSLEEYFLNRYCLNLYHKWVGPNNIVNRPINNKLPILICFEI